MLTRHPRNIEAIARNIILRDEMDCHQWCLHGESLYAFSTNGVRDVSILAKYLQQQISNVTWMNYQTTISYEEKTHINTMISLYVLGRISVNVD